MKRFLKATLILSLLTTLSGCGEVEKIAADDEEAVDYHVAVCLPFTGSNASYANYIKRGMELGAQMLAEDGGLNGKGGKIILDYYDDQNDATEGANIAEKIVSSEDPYYLLEVGSFSSSVSLPCASIYNDAEVPQFALTCSHPDFLKSTDWGFSISMTQDVASSRVAAWDVRYLNKTEIAVIYTNTSWGNECVTYYTKCAEKLGANILDTLSYEEGANDFTTIITKLKSENPELVMCFCGEDDIVNIIKEADKQNFKPVFQVSSKSRTTNVIDNLGVLAEGLYGVYGDEKDPENQIYARYYEAYMKQFADEGEVTQKYADQGYNCFRIISWAIENGGTTREKFRDTLSTLKDFMGVQGTVSFAADRKVILPQHLSVVENGKWRNIDIDHFDVDEIAGNK